MPHRLEPPHTGNEPVAVPYLTIGKDPPQCPSGTAGTFFESRPAGRQFISLKSQQSALSLWTFPPSSLLSTTSPSAAPFFDLLPSCAPCFPLWLCSLFSRLCRHLFTEDTRPQRCEAHSTGRYRARPSLRKTRNVIYLRYRRRERHPHCRCGHIGPGDPAPYQRPYPNLHPRYQISPDLRLIAPESHRGFHVPQPTPPTYHLELFLICRDHSSSSTLALFWAIIACHIGA